jgi:hypothetical protein
MRPFLDAGLATGFGENVAEARLCEGLAECVADEVEIARGADR